MKFEKFNNHERANRGEKVTYIERARFDENVIKDERASK